MFIFQEIHLRERSDCFVGEALLYLYNRYFQRETTFRQHEKTLLIDQCRKHLEANELYLLVEDPGGITRWRLLPPDFQPSPAQIQEPQDPISTEIDPIVADLLDTYDQGKRAFHNINLERRNLSLAQLTQIDLSYGLLNEICLQDADLSRGVLAWAYLKESKLKQARLTLANLEGAYLNWADLSQADLTCATLIQAELTEANLIQAILHGANLQGAELQGADLKQADLRSADLRQANLARTNLTQVDLTGARVSMAQLNKAILWKTILPNGEMVTS